MRSWFAIASLAFSGGAAAQNAVPQNQLPPSVVELRRYVILIGEAQQKVYRENPASLSLDVEIAGLTNLLQSSQLTAEGSSVAYYYRARAETVVNDVRVRNGRKPDIELGRNALADYDKVLSANIEVDPLGVTINDALYGAGVVARTYLADVPLAYQYWSRCAERGQAGCLNIMAHAKLTGAGGVKVDVPGSIELHKKVYDTGTDFTCAGAFSALAVSRIIHFESIGSLTVDELAWLDRANLLLDKLGLALQTKNPCNRVIFDVAEYLIRMARGDTRRPILERALARAEIDWQRTMISYLLGAVGEAAFRNAAAETGSKEAACDMYFAAMWRADAGHDEARAKDYYRLMSELGGDVCDAPLALAKLKRRA
jgi:hypothetical protein